MIAQVKEYNRIDMQKYNARVQEWHNDRTSNNITPQIAFVGFRNSKGDFRNDGFVSFGDNCAKWFKTKKEALASL